jgi:hypothetical protein
MTSGSWSREFGLTERSELAAFLGPHADRIAATVAADVGTTAEVVRPAVTMAIDLLVNPVGPDRGLEIFREQGAASARAGVPRAEFLDRFLTTAWVVWELVCEADRFDSKALAGFGSWLLHGVDLVAAAVAEGYIEADREVMTRSAEARRSFLEELLSPVPPDPAELGRLRRAAIRYGLDVDAFYRLVVISTPTADGDEHALADRVGALIGATTPSRRPRGGIVLPEVLSWRRWIVIVVGSEWTGGEQVRQALGHVAGGRWTALVGPAVIGIGALAGSLGRLTATLRAAERLGHAGWIDSPDDLAVEELLLVDPELLGAVVARELGPLLADPRLGDELVETLRVYLESGQNMRATARRLHLANRTIAYRLERIEKLLGRPLEGPIVERLAVALMAYRIGRPT